MDFLPVNQGYKTRDVTTHSLGGVAPDMSPLKLYGGVALTIRPADRTASRGGGGRYGGGPHRMACWTRQRAVRDALASRMTLLL